MRVDIFCVALGAMMLVVGAALAYWPMAVMVVGALLVVGAWPRGASS